MARKTGRIVETNIDKLREKSEELPIGNTPLHDTIKDKLLSTYRKLDGKMQGMAAIQVGFKYRMVLLRYIKGTEPTVIYNPKVLLKLGFKRSNEGCMSEGDDRYLVWRPALIVVKYYPYGTTQSVTEVLTYKKARIFMHEYDHLNGVLLQDKGIKLEA